MDGGDDVTYRNPGSQPLSDINPEVAAETDYLKMLRGKYHTQFEHALEPGRYDARAGRQMERSRTAIANRFAQSGLAQSSAAFGAQAESDVNIMEQFERQRINDMIRAMQLEQGLSSQITGNIFRSQGQWANMQSELNNAIMQKNAQEQAMWGQMISTGAVVGGTLLAGPAGGMAAGAATGGMGGAGGGGGLGGYVAPSYMSQDYGNQMYNASMQNYGYM